MKTGSRTGARVRSETEVTDKRTRESIHLDSRHKTKQVKYPKGVDAPFAIIKVGNGITLTSKYQGVRVDVGVELPWPCRVGKVEDLKTGFDAAYQFIDDELAERAKEVEPLLRSLAKKYGH